MNQLNVNLPELPYAVSEAMNRLRINIKFCGKNTRRILLTSCQPNEGKSTISAYLWKMLAEAGFPTVLVDVDLTLCLGSYKFVSEISGGLVPTMDISPPDVKVETTFFQRKFFSTTPSNYPQKQYKKRTSDLSEVPILRCFLKTLPLSTPLPASYQIPPNCTLNDISP